MRVITNKISKKGLVLMILSLILIAVIAISGSLAYFTNYDEVTNTFTMGRVKIGLDEPGWDEDDGKELLPGSVRTKDPTVTAMEGQSYMRIRMEIVDGDGNYITDADQLQLILDSLYYDKAYGTALPNIAESQRYSVAGLQTLITQGKIDQQYNKTDFAFAGIETGKPAVRYYNYIANGGIFDATTTPSDTAVLFSNVVIAKDWSNKEIFTLSGDEYEATPTGGLEVIVKGTGYKIRLQAEAIQSTDVSGAAEAFTELDAATGVTRDTSGT